jgi:hypothetical protein
MDGIWPSVFILLALVGLVWLIIRALGTRDADGPSPSSGARHTSSRTPGGHSAESEEALRARGVLPKR